MSEPPKRAAWFRRTDASSVGIEIVVAIVICTIGAFYFEKYVTHWSPWTTLIGVIAGVLTASKAVVRAARAYKAELRADSEKSGDDEG